MVMATDTPSSGSPRSEQETETQTLSTPPRPCRSCHSCNSKKIRCDKRSPCSACTRAARPCTYPPAGPRIRRTKKSIMADMAVRIAGLEKDLSHRRQGKEISREKSPSRSLRSPSSARRDVLVQDGNSSQYFNEIIMSRVIEEDKNVQTVLQFRQMPDSAYPHTIYPFNALGILSLPCPSTPPATFHPSKPAAVTLWNLYIDGVENFIGLKLLHVPTDEVKVFSVVDDPRSASYEDLALNYAIYFSSAISLDDSAVPSTLGVDKQMFLLQCKTGLEQAAAYGNFLNRPTTTGLKALAIYFSALRIHNRGKGVWILNGLAIRIAQSLGLHRDGTHLSLSPFAAETRRRLWWHLLCRDSRAGEDYGLENTSNLLLTSDVRLPLNIDDTDLSPEMERMPVEKKGFTAMTFSLVNIELGKAMQRIAAVASNETSRTQIIQETKARIDALLVHCNPVIPQQRMALLCSQFLLRKLDFITRLHRIFLQRRSPSSASQAPTADFATEANLFEALQILETSLHRNDALLQKYAWATKAYPQYHVWMYVLWHLCVRPEGPGVERAWAVVDALFTREIYDEEEEGSIGAGSKSAVLKALRAKALTLRKSASGAGCQDGGNAIVGPSHGGVECQGTGLSEQTVESASSEGQNFIADLDGDLDWEALIQGFQFDAPEVF
ncbi:hypothetical protein K402DRAFT_400177 [Aulographum hederae CBS 113979]|uniref:Zn(2)-C6 fungal-type domain-containing protein n=1 Tax=Aulographum hederae CBS 113979 TaxID=1176131 RepID=A0A6G1HED5_9PEZI|nr:hypothetical protein K402DRAFT_400177 [Aulographum hederae CBS 113979]